MSRDGLSQLVEEQFVFRDFPVVVAAATLKPDSRGRRRVVSGRGRTDAEALASAHREAAERSSAVWREDDRVERLSFAMLGPNAVDPRKLSLISDWQYDARPEWNQRVHADHRLPARFDDAREIAWIKPANATRRVPAAHCFLGYPKHDEEGFPVPDSSGLAAGQSYEDALRRGFLELVERDAVAIWWYGRHRRPQMDLAATDCPIAWQVSRALAKRGRHLNVLDLTHDLKIPVAAAISARNDGRDLAFGFGAAETAGKAADHAVGELVQFEITRQLRGPKPNHPPDWIDWCRTACVSEHPHLLPEGTSRPVPAPTILSVYGCSELCSTHGLELIGVDLSRRDIGVPVVKAVVPGLRTIWPRFAPGRLYDVPVKLKWREHPTDKTQLNPTPILY